MTPNPTTNRAQDFLSFFDNNLEAAIQALRVQAATQKPKTGKPKVPADAPVVVELRDVTKHYRLGLHRLEALKGVSLTMQQGEFVAITGPSGSGKSTLLQLIGGLDKPSGGEVKINGQNLSKLSDRKLSRFRNQTVGFVFQFFYLQPFLKMGVNLEVPGMFAHTRHSERRTSVAKLAEAVDLSDRLSHLPKQLSGGQMQRAAIARALLNQPKILLADEPTGNLDQVNGRSIIDLFETVRQTFGTTIVIVTHDLDIAARADRQISLADGKILL